jgi:hypothetical protein
LQAYAGIVATLLLVVAKAELTGALADQRQAALESRGLIVRAKGALMERERLDEHEAFTHLRQAARSSGRKLTEVAREVAAGLLPLPRGRRTSSSPQSPQGTDLSGGTTQPEASVRLTTGAARCLGFRWEPGSADSGSWTRGLMRAWVG